MNHYYFKLGLSPDEPAENIRQVFRQQVKLYHPERLGSGRLQFFQELVRAYHTLADPERRREYDRALSEPETGGAAKASPVAGGARGVPRVLPALPVRSIFSVAVFEPALTRASRNLISGTIHEDFSPQGLDLQVVISPAAALAGGVVKLSVPSCSPCNQCGGAGRQGRFPCEGCDGEGLLRHIEEVRFTVPRNAGDGTRIKVPLRGLGPHNFFLSVRIRIAGQIEKTESKDFGT